MNKNRKLIIAGNWKMNKTVAEALALVNGLKLDLANLLRAAWKNTEPQNQNARR